jgi:hypothetical protein
VVFESVGPVRGSLVRRGGSGTLGGGGYRLGGDVGSGLDQDSGMRVVSSVTPWGSAAAIAATEAAYRVGNVRFVGVSVKSF